MLVRHLLFATKISLNIKNEETDM